MFSFRESGTVSQHVYTKSRDKTINVSSFNKLSQNSFPCIGRNLSLKITENVNKPDFEKQGIGIKYFL